MGGRNGRMENRAMEVGGREKKRQKPAPVSLTVRSPTQLTPGFIWPASTYNFNILTHMMETDA